MEVLYSGNTSTFNDLKMLNVLSIVLVMLGAFSNISILVFGLCEIAGCVPIQPIIPNMDVISQHNKYNTACISEKPRGSK